MVHLRLYLLGALQVALDGDPVTSFGSSKAQALLAYLAAESDRLHRRERLAGLLWPERSDRGAMGNLRQTLSVLRKRIGDRDTPAADGREPVLLVTRETVAFNHDSDCWVDVQAFQALLAGDGEREPTMPELAEAVALYRGAFLEGFYIRESAPFDDWALMMRDRLQRQAARALQTLIEARAAAGQYEEACTYAWRWVELEPWQEAAYQRLMTALALGGRRTEALAQFEAACQMLAEEYGVEPSARTVRLWERIRDGTLAPASPRQVGAATPRPLVTPRFVAREGELAALDGHLTAAVAGQGRIALIAGEAGQGKTALIEAFARRALDRYPQLLVAQGNCSTYIGVGDPYLPFREILASLTGDVEAGAVAAHPERARRLQEAFPITVRALIELGPDLIDVLVPGALALRRAQDMVLSGEDRGDTLAATVARHAAERSPGVRQEALLEQVTKVLAAVAHQLPLLLLIDDLQWADLGTIGLLFHIGRRLAGSPMLIVGAYRSEDVAAGRDDARHPLAAAINEFRRLWGDIEIDLDRADGRRFVASLLANEPHRLPPDFEETLFQWTRGHPLFTLELLHGMQARGELVADAEHRWIQGGVLNWDRLPARVEAVIAERIGRLPRRLQALLQVASVEGEVFTAEVAAHAQGLPAREVVEQLSGELDRRYHLVRVEGVRRVDGRRLSQYRVRHSLYVTYLYNTLDANERALLHERIGAALELLYKEHTDAVAFQLARHFEEAALPEQAIVYLQQAGEHALRLSAVEDARRAFERALRLVGTLPATPGRDQLELGLQLGLGLVLVLARGHAAPGVVAAYTRAQALSRALGAVPERFQALIGLRRYHLMHGDAQAAHAMGEEALAVAESLEDPGHLARAHAMQAELLYRMGAFAAARDHALAGYGLYDPARHRSHTRLYGNDTGAVCRIWGALAAWHLGYADQAIAEAREALAIADALGHGFTRCLTYLFAATLASLRREMETTCEWVETALQIASANGFVLFRADSMGLQGWTLAEQGHIEEGLGQMRQALDTLRLAGTVTEAPLLLVHLAATYGRAGRVEEALRVLDEALALMVETGYRYAEADALRLRGMLLLQQGARVGEVARHLGQALGVAHAQQTRALALRITLSLSRLLAQQGRPAEARAALDEIYGEFGEGLDAADLHEARALLDAL